MLKKLITTVSFSFLFAMAGNAQEIDLTEKWQILRDSQPADFDLTAVPVFKKEDLPEKDAAWIDYDLSRTRNFRLQKPYQTGLPVWLGKEITLPEDIKTRPYVLELGGGRRTVNAVFANGVELKDISGTQIHVPMPEQIKDLDKGQKPNIAGNRKMWLYWGLQDDDTPALFYLDPNAVKPGNNNLLVNTVERYAFNKLFDPCRIRPATLKDMAIPYSYSVPIDQYHTEIRAGLLQRFPYSTTITAKVNIVDRLGVKLRSESHKIKLGALGEHGFTIPIKSNQDYKAIITYTDEKGKVLATRWAYFFPLVKKEGTRTVYSLEGPWWEDKGFTLAEEEPTFPLTDDEEDQGPKPIAVGKIEDDAAFIIGQVKGLNWAGWSFDLIPESITPPKNGRDIYSQLKGKKIQLLLRYDGPGGPAPGYKEFVKTKIRPGKTVAVKVRKKGDKYYLREIPRFVESQATFMRGKVVSKNWGGWFFDFIPSEIVPAPGTDKDYQNLKGKKLQIQLRYDGPGGPAKGYKEFVKDKIQKGQTLTVRVRKVGDKYQLRQLPRIAGQSSQEGWKPSYAPCKRTRDWDEPLKINGKDAHRMLLRRSFTLPKEMQQAKRLVLRISGIMEKATCYINDKKVGIADFTQTAGEFDIADKINRKGKNEIVILVDTWPAFATGGPYKDGDKFPQGLAGSGTLGGSFMHVRDEISIIAMPEVRTRYNWVRTSVKNKELNIRSRIENKEEKPITATIRYAVIDKDKELFSFSSKPIEIPAGQTAQVSTNQKWADPKLWSIWDPNLYGLRIETVVDGKVVDSTNERFGFREITVEGKNILMNGKVIHLIGRMVEQLHFALGMVDADNVANYIRSLREENVNITRDSIGVAPAYMWDFMDEIGFYGGTQSLPWCNGQALYRIRDPKVHQSFLNHITSYADEHYNHPSIVQWNYGNEMHSEVYRTPEVQKLLGDVGRAVKKYDPTRFTKADGSKNPDNGFDVDDPHYFKVSGYDDHKKPVITGEFSWNRYPMSGYFWLGEEASKPSPLRRRRGWDKMSCEMISMIPQREADNRKYRTVGMAGYVTLSPERIGKNLAPLYADFDDGYRHVQVHNGWRRLWSGEDAEVDIVVANDSGEKADFNLKLQEKTDSGEKVFWTHKLTLDQGGFKTLKAKVPSFKDAKVSEHNIELVLTANGKVQTVRNQMWIVFPKGSVGAIPKLDIAVFDPENKGAAKLIEALGLKPKTVKNLAELGTENPPQVVVLGPDLSPEIMAKQAHNLLDFVKEGGMVLVLPQSEDVDWLPLGKLKVKSSSESPGNLVCTYAPDHPIFDGMVKDDLYDWAPTGFVRAGKHFAPPAKGSYRILAGFVPETVDLIEAPLGKGRFVICGLNLTAETVSADPAPARLLANMLRYSQMSATKPAKVLVLSPADGLHTKKLKDDLRLIANFASDPATDPAGYDLVVLCDWKKSPFNPKQGKRLKSYLEQGGKLLLDGMTPQLQKAFEEILGMPIERKKIITVRAVKRKEDPLLSGISDGDLAYFNVQYSKWEQNVRLGKGLQDVVRETYIPKGAEVMTWPALLNRTKIGKGQLIISNPRWAETERKTRAYWGYDAKKIGLAYMQKLLGNLGAGMKVPERAKAASLVGYDFTPMDMSMAFNRSWVDEKPKDKVGWIDIGPNYDMRHFPTGPLVANGVKFDIPKYGPSGKPASMMLGGKKALAHLPDFTKAIPVNEKVDGFAFLHAAGWLQSPDGTPSWQYEIRYKGFKDLTLGADTSAFVEILPIKANVDFGDWLGKSFVKPAYRFEDKKINTFVKFWPNPRPETPVESILVRSLRQSEVPMIFAISKAKKAKNWLETIELTKIEPFVLRKKGYGNIKSSGTWIGKGWNFHHWNKGAIAEISRVEDPLEKAPAIKLSNYSAPTGGMFYNKKVIDAKAGKTYLVQFSVMTTGKGKGFFMYGIGEGKQKVALLSPKAWTPQEIKIKADKDGPLLLRWQCDTTDDNAMYLRDFGLYEVAE